MTAGHPNGSTDEAEARDFWSVAQAIDDHKADILELWADRVSRDLERPLGPTQLHDAVPDYLTRVVAALRSGDPLSHGESIWGEVAREHALMRVSLGFDVSELIHEFIVLRQVLSEVVSRGHAEIQPAEIVTALIEAAISASVRNYVEARDYAAQQKEAEHIAFITHELRNPLSAVKLAASRLRRSAVPAEETLLEMVERNVKRLEALIDRVLSLERLQVGKVQPQVTEVDLEALLSRTLETARMAAEGKGLALIAEYDPHQPVLADPELAASAISNVIDNAVKYTDAGEIRIVAEPTTDRVVIHVWDNCQGLSREELQVIFEPFKRGASKRPGSGLGLAIARRALEAQGGSIGAESPGERGCHFWLALRRVGH
jgi:two-component system phosphate regulon sensor histidine kinase PhoR